MVGDGDGRDGAAEAEHGGGHDDGHGGAGGRYDGTHGQRQDELRQEDHGGHDAHVRAYAADLHRVAGGGAVLVGRLLLLLRVLKRGRVLTLLLRVCCTIIVLYKVFALTVGSTSW